MWSSDEESVTWRGVGRATLGSLSAVSGIDVWHCFLLRVRLRLRVYTKPPYSHPS